MGPPEDRDGQIGRLQDRSPGQDDEDPYEDVDIDSLPAWWRAAIEEHRAYGLRPYRPPRFTDGEIYQEVKGELEESIGEEIRLVCYDVEESVWDVVVGGEKVDETKRWRSPEGYSVIELTSDDFRVIVTDSA